MRITIGWAWMQKSTREFLCKECVFDINNYRYHRSHFATCPGASLHRKKGKKINS